MARAPSPLLAGLLLPALLLAAPAAAQDEAEVEERPVRGWAEVSGWAAPDDELVQGGGRGRLELWERVSLDGAWSGAQEASRERRFAWGRLGVGDFRLAGGELDGDRALHVGYRPELHLVPARWLHLRGGLDMSVGAAWLDGDAPLSREDSPTRGVYVGGIDLYSSSVAAQFEVTVFPLEMAFFSAGAWGDLFLAIAPSSEHAPGGLDNVARFTDLGLSGALSQGGYGLYGRTGLRLLQWERQDGRWAEALLSYTEAWDWVYLDLAYTTLEREDALPGLRLRDIPPRSTRSLAFRSEYGWSQDISLSLGLEVRHVRDSTTMETFADRDGTSVAARVGARFAPLEGWVEGRYHLEDADVERFWGEMPRYQVRAGLRAELYRSRATEVALQGGFDVTLEDSFGLPREGWATSLQLAVAFGGAATPRAGPAYERWLRVPIARRTGLGARIDLSGAEQLPWEDRAALGQLAGNLDLAEARQLYRDFVARLRDEEGGIPLDPDAIRSFLDRNPDLVARLNEAIATTGLSGPVGGAAVGYKRRGFDLAPVTVGSGAHEPSLALEALRLEGLGVDVLDDGDGRLTTTEYVAAHLRLPASLRSHLRDAGWEKVTLVVPRGSEREVLFQGQSAWGRMMRFLLSDR